MNRGNQRYAANDPPLPLPLPPPPLPPPPSCWDWVDPQVLTTKSTITSFHNLPFTPAKILLPHINPKTLSFLPCTDFDRVCHSGEGFFFLYTTLFTHFKLTLPFSDFQVAVLNAINAAPTQLHPDAWALLTSFELLCNSLSLTPTVSTFFFFFQSLLPLHHRKPKMSWISIQPRPFAPNKILALDQSSSTFKNLFFRVQGGTTEASIPFFMDQNRNPKFPLHWSKSVRSPDQPDFSVLPDCDRALVNKLKDLKSPISCAALISGKHSPVPRPRLDELRVEEVKEEEEEEEEEEGVTTTEEAETERKRVFFTPGGGGAAAKQRKKQKNGFDAEEETENVADLEGEGVRNRNASVWDRSFDVDGHVRQQLFFCGDQGKLRRAGRVEVGRALKAEALRMAVGVEFLMEDGELMLKEVLRLTSELQEEKKRRVDAEAVSLEEKSARKKAEAEVAAAKEEVAQTRRLILEWKKSCPV